MHSLLGIGLTDDLICDNLWTKKNSVEKKAVNLRKQAVTTKCRDNINAEPAVPLKKPCSSVPKIKICDNHNIFRY